MHGVRRRPAAWALTAMSTYPVAARSGRAARRTGIHGRAAGEPRGSDRGVQVGDLADRKTPLGGPFRGREWPRGP